jgi:hypothetical protein
MPLSMYQASVPVFTQLLNALSKNLEKAQAHTSARNLDPAALLAFRLYPDMFPFTRQVQLATDFARGCSARLAGLEMPAYENSETSFAELEDRIGRTVAFLGTLKAEQIDGSEDRECTFAAAGRTITLKGQHYLMSFALPHVCFHCTTAYDMLRHNGVEVGKRDYLGAVPGLNLG